VRRRPRLRVVGPPRPRRVPFLLVAFVVVGTLVTGIVSLQALVAQTSFRMQALTRRSSELEESYGRLKLELARLSSPDRIVREAHRLGYGLPEEVRTLPVAGGRQPDPSLREDQPAFSLKPILGGGP
jgi:hypothetical protein